MLVECGRGGIPVAVVNARVSDRSYARGMRVRAIWGQLLRRVGMFLAQSDEDARRLVAMGARESSVRAIGNLKYDVRAARATAMTERIRSAVGDARLVVAGSLLEGEETALLAAWQTIQLDGSDIVLLLAPRHPQRFGEVVDLVRFKNYAVLRCSTLDASAGLISDGTVLVLDTLGDLAAVYGLADVAFVGGSLVKRGGHSPLEPAQFGVPVIMGPSYENFRDVVGKMQAAKGICIVRDKVGLEAALADLLTDREVARAMGDRGRAVFEAQSGATGRAVEALVGMVKP
jgi:3-deoxy-D-manno-octulosonic-acid transferase